MSEHQPSEPSRHRSDRWSSRKTLLVIIIASALLWALIAFIIHLMV